MKITLINARNSDSTVTPYGLLSIAAVLEKEGYSLQVFDPFFENLTFVDNVVDFNPDLIGISALTASYPQARGIINALRRSMPQAKICMGGIHATALPEKTLRDLPLDFVVLGEGELVLLDICRNFSKIDNLEVFEGIAFLRNGRFIEKTKKPLIENLDGLPYPAWHLLPIEKYFIPPGYIRSYYLERTLVFYSARGCPYQCIFCASHKITGRKLRRHSVNYFLNHLDCVSRKYKLDGAYIMDDTFIIDDSWVAEFCRQKKNRGMNILWGCQGRVNSITEEKLLMLKGAGCVQIDFGVESGSPRVLKAIKKDTEVAQIVRAFDLCHKVGIRPYASIMVGNPEEDESDVLLTKRLIKRIKAVYTSVGFCQPIPGSELYSLAKKNGWFDDNGGCYGQDWDVRLSKEPIMSARLTNKQLKVYRAELQNAAFLKNYIAFINLRSIPFILNLLRVIIDNPAGFLKAVIKSFQTHKLDDCIDFILNFYRLRMMKMRITNSADL